MELNADDPTTSLPNAREITDDWCLTSPVCNTVFYTWTISNWSLRKEECGNFLMSAPFPAKSIHSTQWRLKLFPRGANRASSDFLSIFVCMDNDNTNVGHKYIQFRISIKNEQRGDSFYMVSPKSHHIRKRKEVGFTKFIRLGTLFSEQYKFLPDDQLILHFKMNVLNGDMTYSNLPTPTGKDFPKCTLVADLGTLLDNDMFTDITFKVNGQEFKAHKAILSARSAIFKAMLSGKYTEGKSPIELRDINPQTFKQLLNYLYTGKLPDLYDKPDDLYITADKYCLNRLRSYCENTMILSISEENAVRYLLLADTYSAIDLKIACMCYINTHAPKFMDSIEFTAAMDTKPMLLHELYTHMSQLFFDSSLRKVTWGELSNAANFGDVEERDLVLDSDD